MAWKLICHNHGLDKLAEDDPRFADCPLYCSQPFADRPRGCPDCTVTQMARELDEELDEEFQLAAERMGHNAGHKFPWSHKRIRADLAAVSSLDAVIGGSGISPSWTVRQRLLVGILREERAKFRAAEFRKNLPAKPKGDD